MRTLKPILTIDKFSGSGQNGILYCDGVFPEVDNGKSVMSEGYYTQSLTNSTVSGMSNLGIIYSTIGLTTINSTSSFYQLMLNSTGKIHSYSVGQADVKTGVVHSSGVTVSSKPDFIETSLGNILYTQSAYIGRGVRGKATGGSTTTLIDTTRNFGTLGYAAADKVTNLKTGIEYTITSISTTTNTNDTLNFSASGTNTTSANDEFIVWEDDRLSITSAVAPWQPALASWVRQIKQYSDIYLFTQGNYIGSVLADEATVNATYKQLPLKHQAIAMETNTGKLLVSSVYNGKGVLLLWDGYSDGWNNILEVDTPVNALVNYGSGWVYVANGIVYYTDGYQVQKLYDSNQSGKLSQATIQSASYNGLVIYRDTLYCANNNPDNNLIDYGVYVIDLLNVSGGFTIIKCVKTTLNNGFPYSLALINRFANYQSIVVGGDTFFDSIFYGSHGGQYLNKSFIISIDTQDPIHIKGIGLNLKRYLKDYNEYGSQTRQIQVSVGDGERGLISLAQTNSGGFNASTLTVSGVTYPNNEVGDEVLVRSDNFYGERSFITAITDKGSSGELWTVSPAFSVSSPTIADLKIIKVKKLDIKTVNYNDFNKEIMFFGSNTGTLTNQIYIEVVLYGGTSKLPINISSINIYGD